MIISQTPLRISFLGGGTDYPEYFTKYGGAVLGTAINKFAYLSAARFYSQLFDYSIRISYRQVECVKTLDEIQHAPFREVFRWCNVTNDVEVNYTAELPAFTGLGSSSTFVVGLLNSLYAFQGRSVGRMELAYQAIEIEREVLKENVGCQDQTFAAMGGFNLIEFRSTRDILVNRVALSDQRLREFEEHLMVFFTGIRRPANEIAAKQIRNIEKNRDRLAEMRRMVDKGYKVLTGGGSLAEFGALLHQAWCQKRELDASISNGVIEKIYAAGREAGALGGKLLGAGGGGFMLFFVPPERKQRVRDRLSHLQEVPVQINSHGSYILHA